MSRTDQTSMEDLLSRRVVDEKEKSPDDNPDGSIADRDEPEAFEGKEPFSETPDQQPEPKQDQAKGRDEPKTDAQPKAKPEDDDGEGEPEGRRMDRLPKWAYLRLQANNQKVEAALKEAAELKRQLQELQAGRQQGEGQEQQEDWTDWTKKQIEAAEARFDQRDWVRRNQFGWRLAVKEYGEETTREAASWAADMMEADRAFAAAIRQADDPVEFSVVEFRNAQLKQELQKHGGSMDALIKARLEAEMKKQTQPAAGAQTGAASQPLTTQQTNSQEQPRMPNDFASANSGAGRVNEADTGPTPLSELLQLNNGRRRGKG